MTAGIENIQNRPIQLARDLVQYFLILARFAWQKIYLFLVPKFILLDSMSNIAERLVKGPELMLITVVILHSRWPEQI